MLNQKRGSGYELARRFERTVWHYAWHAQESQIYPELVLMEADSLITVVASGPRRRRVYSITRFGQAELLRWLQHRPAHLVVRSEFILRLLLLSTLDAADARSLLAPVADDAARELERLRARAVAGVTGDGGAPPTFDRLTDEFSLRYMEAVHQWALWALDELETRG